MKSAETNSNNSPKLRSRKPSLERLGDLMSKALNEAGEKFRQEQVQKAKGE